MSDRPRWRGSLLTAACIAAFFAIFFLNDCESRRCAVKPWLLVLGIGAAIGGALSVVDAVRQMRSRNGRRSRLS